MPSCPVCKQPLPSPEPGRFTPFCSERCKLIDLGLWLSEGYCVPAQDPADEGDVDAPFGPSGQVG